MRLKGVILKVAWADGAVAHRLRAYPVMPACGQQVHRACQFCDSSVA